MISFRGGKTKVRIITKERVTTPYNTSPLYAEGVHMLDGLADDEVHDFLEDHPTIIPLFEIDAISAVDTSLDEEVMEDIRPQDEPDGRYTPSRNYDTLGRLLNVNSPSPSEWRHQCSNH